MHVYLCGVCACVNLRGVCMCICVGVCLHIYLCGVCTCVSMWDVYMYICVCVHVGCVSVCVHMPVRLASPWELELQMNVRIPIWMLRTELRPLASS